MNFNVGDKVMSYYEGENAGEGEVVMANDEVFVVRYEQPHPVTGEPWVEHFLYSQEDGYSSSGKDGGVEKITS